jgi:glucosamine kinase
MIAVVYSGSNHADWRLSDKGRTIASFKTNGINPYFIDEKHIILLLNKNINLIHHAEEIKRIYFFGAGSSSKQLQTVVYNALNQFFKFGKVTVSHDIEGAAIACYRNTPGIIGICGSGSNAAWYDGRKVKPNNYGLGYILADEGSGNWLGKQLIKAFMNVHKYEADRKTLLEKVYRQKQTALYLSSFSDFYIDNFEDEYLKSVIKDGFSRLISTYLLPLHEQYPQASLHFEGSVAFAFQDYLRETAAEAGLEIAGIIKEPINNLLTYYSNKN